MITTLAFNKYNPNGLWRWERILDFCLHFVVDSDDQFKLNLNVSTSKDQQVPIYSHLYEIIKAAVTILLTQNLKDELKRLMYPMY